jgi:hypothetical protein
MDIIEFSEKYNVFFNPVKGIYEHGVKLQDYEKDFLYNLIENKFTIDLQSRQMNITTLLSVYSAYNLIYGIDDRTMYLSSKLDLSYRFIELVKNIIHNFCELNELDYNVFYKINNKYKIQINNNILIVRAANSDAFRGFTLNRVIIDNAAFIDGLENMFGVMMANMAYNSYEVHITSCANEINYFHTLYFADNNFKKSKYHYSLNTKRYTPENIEQIKRNIPEEMWLQEMELEFLTVKKTKSYNVQVRVDFETLNKITNKINTLKTNISDYIRDLIIKDLGD